MGRTSDARERLVDSASELIHSGGFGAAGVQEICTHAGVKKGSFYHFFPSKLDLALEVVGTWQDKFDAFLAGSLGDDVPPLARIGRLFEAVSRFQEAHRSGDGFLKGCPLGNLALETCNSEERLRTSLDAAFGRAIDRLAAVIEAAHAAGEIGSVESRSTALAVFSLLEGSILMAKTRNDASLIAAQGPAAVAMVRQLAGPPSS